MDHEFLRDEQEQERRRLIRLEIKRKRILSQRIGLIAIVLVLVLIIALIVNSCSGNTEKQRVEEDKNNASNTLQEQTKDIKVTLAAVGDIMCYDNQIAAALQADGTYDFSQSFAAVKPYLENANITVGNLELNFCGKEAGYKGYPSFNAPESLAATLKDCGFDLLQTANTYSIQNGINGLTSTIRHLAEQGIQHLGTYHTKEDKTDDNGVILRNVNGIRIAFLAYTKGLNNMTLPADAGYAVDVLFEDYSTYYSKINKTQLLKSVQTAKDMDADIIVAMLHWGNEYEIQPLSIQEEIADLLFKNGVDVILGSHSHEAGPMQWRTVEVDGRKKQVFMAYSLGNFFSSMDKNTSQTSLILNLEFTMDGETGDVSISGAEYLPVYISDNGENSSVRYEMLPIRTAMQNSVFSHMQQTLANALVTLQTNVGAEFDSGK